MKKIMVFFSLLLCISGCGNKEILGEKEEYENRKYQETNKKTNTVLLELDDERKILIELYPDIAPISVKNFQKLVENDFYNDIIFHRVVHGFVIQAGDGTSLGKSANTIKGEFKSNGVENNLSHERGVVSMARANAKDSASSQFFIMLEDNKNLDGEYAAFGRVLAGMEVVDSIGNALVDSNAKPIKDIKIKKAEFVKVSE